MQEGALGEGDEARQGLAGRGPGVQAAPARQPEGRRAEGHAEGLVPPAAPEAGEALVEDVGGEGAVGGGVVPELGAGAQEPAGEEVEADELPEGHEELDGDDDGGEGEHGAVGEEDRRRERGEEGGEGQCAGGGGEGRRLRC